MEVFMRNVDWNFTRLQVAYELANILHGPAFAHFSPTRLNFHVHLHPDKRRIRNHSGTGALTLPSAEIGGHFLALYGTERPEIPLVIGKKIVFFSISRRPKGRADVIEVITLQPYVDPRVAEERERRVAQLSAGRISVKTLQFGWECRDQVFSIECEERCENQCFLSFSEERRELQISLLRNPETYIVALPYSHIDSITVHTYLQHEHAIVFSLNTPPTYERLQQPLRQRLSFLPIPDHERVAPYASVAIRLICPSMHDLENFRRLSTTAQLHKVYDYEFPVVHRNIFSAVALEQLQTYLRQFNWCVAFQIESLMRSLVVDVKEVLALIPDIIRIVKIKGREFAATVLRKFKDQPDLLLQNDDDDPQATNILQCFRDTEEKVSKQGTIDSLKPTEGSLCDSFRVTITPTTMLLDGPCPERSNRVIRAYEAKHQESFLRVSFLDESKLRFRFDREVDGPEFIRAHVGSLLKNGLTIARRSFKFLAYSQSALKEHAVWFVKPFRDRLHGYVDAATIRGSLGKFDNLSFDERLMYCPARYAARISQAFTATDAVSIEVEEIFEKDDISTLDKKYHFTDGVGTLSKELACEIWTQLKSTKRRGRLHKEAPSAYQIRFGGSKGMLSVDYSLSGYAICRRPSMTKFEVPASSQKIEIARAFDRPGLYYLNRPLIMLLEGLGIPFDVFKDYQDNAVLETRKAAQSLGQAAALLESYGLGASYRLPSVMRSLEKLYVSSLPDDKFYEKMLEYAINHVLRLLKNQARIPIPKAWTLVGVADVHQYLEPNQIFACIKPINGGRRYLKGPIVISRSPTIHPGDVMIVNAIGKPPPGSCFSREPLANTVVFSVQGDRPVPSCLGGGDLDGDVYNLIPLEDLPEFTPRHLHPPASYDPAPKKFLNHPSTIDDVADFVMEYINSDVVGIIAINWLIIADQSTKGIFDPDCMTLANLHSNAVDYPKSGQPVPLTDIPKLKHRIKPDWNAPETVNASSGSYYESSKAIGRLFRAIDLPVEQQKFKPHPRQKDKRRQNRDQAMEDLEHTLSNFNLNSARNDYLFAAVEGRVQEFIYTDVSRPREQLAFVAQLFSRYTSELRAICAANTLSHARTAQLSEEEAVIGTIVQKSSQPRKRKDMMSTLREATDVLVRAVREDLDGDDSVSHEESLERAWMAWELSVAKGKMFGSQSFGWVALGAIFEAIREIENEEKTY